MIMLKALNPKDDIDSMCHEKKEDCIDESIQILDKYIKGSKENWWR